MLPETCPHLEPQKLAQFLNNELSPAAQTDTELHVAECPTCQRRIEQTAADADWWTEAESFLTDDEIDRELAAGITEVLDQSRTSVDARQILAWLDPTDDPRMLGRLAGYEISGIVGTGGMSVVLKGLDTALNRYVAIKVLAPHLASSGAARQRFAREARAAAAVVHDNVIAIHGVAETHGLPYLVMPYIRGTSLQRRIDSGGPLQVSEILRIGMQTAAGLAAAHAQGLVHRDVKPANILLDGTTERVLLTDFGLARAADDASVTRSGVIAGTPHFMSPEQAQGEGINHKSDLFSLGSVLYAMSTGRPPFRAETSWGILQRVCEAKARPVDEVNPDIPVWLSHIIARLHSPLSTNRYETANEVHDILEACLAHVQHPQEHTLPTECRVTEQPKAGLRTGNWYTVFFAFLALLMIGPAWMYVAQMLTPKTPEANSQKFPDVSKPEEDDTANAANEEETSGYTVHENDSLPNGDEGVFRRDELIDPTLLQWDDGTDEILKSMNQTILELEKD